MKYVFTVAMVWLGAAALVFAFLYSPIAAVTMFVGAGLILGSFFIVYKVLESAFDNHRNR